MRVKLAGFNSGGIEAMPQVSERNGSGACGMASMRSIEKSKAMWRKLCVATEQQHWQP